MAKTKQEKEHYDKLHQIGCIVCLREGHGYIEPTIHHTRFDAGMGMKSNWGKAIPLCPMHHQHGARAALIVVRWRVGRHTAEHGACTVWSDAHARPRVGSPFA